MPQPIKHIDEITVAQIQRVVGNRGGKQPAIVQGVIDGFAGYGAKFNLLKPVHLWDTWAQIAHESARFITTKEFGRGQWYWPHIGRGVLQRTHLEGYQKLTRWIWKHIDDKLPDFSLPKHWHNLEKFPYAFFGIPEFWELKGLARFSDRNDFLTHTKRINGGTNGLSDRKSLRGRFGLFFLGYKIEYRAFAKFQADHGLRQTDRFDKATELKMYELLKALPPLATKQISVGTGELSKEFEKQLGEWIMSIISTIVGALTGKGMQTGILGGLLTALGMGAVADPVPGMDLTKLDPAAVFGSVAGVIMAVKQAWDTYKEGQEGTLPSGLKPTVETIGGEDSAEVVNANWTIDAEEIADAVEEAFDGKGITASANDYANNLTGLMLLGSSRDATTLVAKGIKMGAIAYAIGNTKLIEHRKSPSSK